VKLKFCAFILFFGVAAIGQSNLPVIKFRQGNRISHTAFLENIDPASTQFQRAVFENELFTFLQFKDIPSPQITNLLKQNGIELLEYIPDNTYLVKIKGFVSMEILRQFKVINNVLLWGELKIDPALVIRQKESAFNSANQLELLVTGFPGIDNEKMINEFAKMGIAAEVYKKAWVGAVKISVSAHRLQEVSDAPFIYYIEELPPAEQPLNFESNVLHGVSVLQNTQPGIGRSLSGKGVVIGMGDMGGAGHHIDHYYKTIEPAPSAVNHSTHVAGIMSGAGLVNPRMKGRAPQSTLVIENFSEIFFSSPELSNRYGMVLTNNSYGSTAANCRNFGNYNTTARYIDQQLLDYPDIMHVFGAGNEVTSACVPYPAGYLTVFGGPQSAKNTITVGGSNKFETAGYYSKGPTKDGRIKPEIIAIGRNVFSTVPGNTYSANNGTSMACPQVTGSLALLIERYRQLNNGSNPSGALLKNIICNSTEDIGNTGPDFANGYGWLNALPAIEILEKKNYFASSIQQSQEQTKSFTIGSNVSEVRLMLYWPDIPASLYAATTLVNDLDILVSGPDGTIHKPLVLNSNSILNTAVGGEDHTNNIEQLIIRNPLPGNYVVTVKGYSIPMGSQSFNVSYNIIEKGLKLLSPLKKDSWKAGEPIVIKWDEPGENPTGYNVEFSGNGGLNWQQVGTTAGNIKQLNFQAPPITTTNARLRITNTTNGQVVIADSLVVLPELNFKLESKCDGIIEVSWPIVPGIDSVAILMIDSGEMKELSKTKDSVFVVKNLSTDSLYWVSLYPIKNGIRGERAIAKSIQPIGTGCTLTEFDGDILLVSISNPSSGRKNTSIERSQAEKVSIEIKNLDNEISTSALIIKTYLDNILIGKDTLSAAIAPFGTQAFTLNKTIDLSAVGVYSIRVEVEKSGDSNISNNILEKTVKITSNEPIQLPFSEDFQSLKDTIYKYPGYFGLEGKDNWDYITSNNTGLLKTAITSPNKGLLTTKLRIRPLVVTNTVTGTFNLLNYSIDDNIFLSVNTINRNFTGLCFIRGNDTAPWVQLTFAEATQHGNISHKLGVINQQLSSSFQLRFESIRSEVGVTQPDTTFYYDDITIYTSSQDVNVHRVSTDLSRYFPKDTVVVTAVITNNVSQPLNQVALQAGIGSTVVNDTIPFINPYDTVIRIYRIVLPATKVFATEQVFVRAIHPSDTYTLNNEKRILISVYPVVDQFPYLESFEGENNNWVSSSAYYDLVNIYTDRYIKNAANGKKFWYTANVNENYPEIRGSSLISHGFDLSKVKNAYLSFSTARYFRRGRDSAIVQISYNKGLNWIKLNSSSSYNWYDYKNNSSWSDSDKVYWHSVSCKLPDTNRVVMLRIFINKIDSFKLPIWLGSMAIDDIHIYSLTKTIADSIHQQVSGSFSSTGNEWKEMEIDGKVTAAVNFNGQDPGMFNWQFIPFDDSVLIMNGHKLLKNRWIFRSTRRLTKPVAMRFYFSDREAQMLRVLNRCINCLDTCSSYQFGIYQFAGSSRSINAQRHDNAISSYKFIPASAFELVPYANGYYAEIQAEAEGEFYIQMPERFERDLNEFIAKPGQNNATRISWISSNQEVIEKYELEKAVGHEAFESGRFATIFVQPVSVGSSYGYNDLNPDKDLPNYYRLKTTYKNGYIMYSPEQLVNLKSIGDISVYPNPSNGLFNLSIPQSNGDDLFIQVVNSIGQVILTSKRQPAGVLDEIKIDIRNAIYPPGVYFLKINNGNVVKTFKLVKQ